MSAFRIARAREGGFAFAYVAVILFVVLMGAGLALDLGRGYVVRAHLAKAVDGAALAAARAIPAGFGTAQAEAAKIFNANFPPGFLGVTSVASPPTMSYTTAGDGSLVIDVSSTAEIPTTFMKIAGFGQLTVRSQAQTTRRLVDVAFVVDKSGSLNSVWNEVKAAAQQFVSYFDPARDRLALVMFSGNTIVMDPMSASRGFDLAAITSHIASATTTGSTGTSEGLYAGWDQLRSVPGASQSTYRIVVLFTDGAPNTFSGTFSVQAASGNGSVPAVGALHTDDFPNVNGQGQNDPADAGLYHIYGTTGSPGLQNVAPTNGSYTSGNNTVLTTVNGKIPTLPLASTHPTHASFGIPTSFPLYNPALPSQRPLVGGNGSGYPNHVRNANDAARNLTETVANAIRSDASGSGPIRIYALGLGDLLNANAGAVPETGASFLKRIANDRHSPDFNPAETEGKYFFAGDATQLRSAFEAVRNEIVRMTR